MTVGRGDGGGRRCPQRPQSALAAVAPAGARPPDAGLQLFLRSAFPGNGSGVKHAAAFCWMKSASASTAGGGEWKVTRVRLMLLAGLTLRRACAR